jgi:hypothetical protein
MEGTDNASNQQSTKNSGQFTPIRVAFLDGTRNWMNCSDCMIVGGANKGECGSTTFNFIKGGVTDCKTLTRRNGCSNVCSAIRSVDMSKGPFLARGKSSDVIIKGQGDRRDRGLNSGTSIQQSAPGLGSRSGGANSVRWKRGGGGVGRTEMGSMVDNRNRMPPSPFLSVCSSK